MRLIKPLFNEIFIRKDSSFYVWTISLYFNTCEIVKRKPSRPIKSMYHASLKRLKVLLLNVNLFLQVLSPVIIVPVVT